MSAGLPVIENIFRLLTKSVLIPLGLTTAAPGRDAAILQKMFKSEETALIILNKGMNYIMKIVESLEESDLLKSATETIINETKNKNMVF